MSALTNLNREIIQCRSCPRLVEWRETTAISKVKRYADHEYWGKPLPGFGDPRAVLLLVGLAPAAHGGNRTGRMFTGDRSGDWLYRALFKSGFASRKESVDRFDGMILSDCYITAAVRCAPPQNKPLPEEMHNCQKFLLRELSLLKNVCVVVGLGKIGFDAALDAYRSLGRISFEKRPGFSHAAVHRFGSLACIASFHPSQQNTFTGRLTEPMFDRVFTLAKRELVRFRRAEE